MIGLTKELEDAVERKQMLWTKIRDLNAAQVCRNRRCETAQKQLEDATRKFKLEMDTIKEEEKDHDVVYKRLMRLYKKACAESITAQQEILATL